MTIEIRPQPGPQEKALASAADIVLMGGAKGGGKSYVMRLAPVRHVGVPGFHAVIFRRSLPQQKRPGGQWDKSFELYPYLGGLPRKSELKWLFPAGSSIMFSHLADENDWLDWQGTETALFGFDQLEEFTQTQFLKILGCMRSTCGVRTQLWATMNPDADSWVRQLVAPWIAEDGYIDPDQDGTIKYFTVMDDVITWVDASWRDENGQPPKSIVYISADIWDNPALLAEDPNYLSSLMAQSLVDRERFLGVQGRGGNWNVKATAGKIFRSEWFEIVDALPPGGRLCRFWDFAATEKQTRGDDPDYTVGCKLLAIGNEYYVLDVVRGQYSPLNVYQTVRNTASQDGRQCLQRWEQEHGGSAAIRDSASLRSQLAGYDALGILPYGDKVQRAKPASSAAEHGRIKLLRGTWNQVFLNELQSFPDGAHDDQVDGLSGAYNCLTQSTSSSTGQYKA